jgi:hypothetical protein
MVFIENERSHRKKQNLQSCQNLAGAIVDNQLRKVGDFADVLKGL